MWRSLSTSAPEAASLVPLPCRVFGAEQDQYLTDAVPSTLSTALGKVAELDTRSPPTSFQVDPREADITGIAEAYGVQNCVTCSVTATNGRLVLGVQLVEAQSRRLLWTEEYEGTKQGYLDLARRAADGLRQALLPDSAPIAEASAVASASQAELAFQRGVYYHNRYNNLHEQADFETAHAAFELRRSSWIRSEPTPPP